MIISPSAFSRLGDLDRIVGPLEARHLGLGLVMHLHVGLEVLMERENRRAHRVDGLAVGRHAGGGCRQRCRRTLVDGPRRVGGVSRRLGFRGVHAVTGHGKSGQKHKQRRTQLSSWHCPSLQVLCHCRGADKRHRCG